MPTSSTVQQQQQQQDDLFHELSSTHSSNYSFTQHEQQRVIHMGDSETRLKQLYQQIEQLSLSNARLVRANRILKLDCDRIVDEKTQELKQALKLSIEQNIRLQRSNRLLKDDYDLKTQELNEIKNEQIRKMKSVGPEYEYLVQVVNLLYRQLAGNSNCKESCCFTQEKSSIATNTHLCRPIIKSHIQSGDIAVELEKENHQLRDNMNNLLNDRERLYQLLKDKEEDNETLKYELKVKDDIVKQLENDFEKMELEVTDLQKDWGFHRSADSSFSELRAFPSVPT